MTFISQSQIKEYGNLSIEQIFNLLEEQKITIEELEEKIKELENENQ